ASIRFKDKVSIDVIRDKKPKTLTGIGRVKPLVTLADFKVEYNWLAVSDCKLRMISYHPQKLGKYPTILLIPGYNCGSIEGFATSYNGKIIAAWVSAGYAVVTVEKSGVGDSYGCIPCTEVDLATDIDYFKKAYYFMKSFDFVDNNNLFIWGHSMGGVIAPELAKEVHPKGVMVFATVYRPWSEFLLEMHRIQAPLDGKTYAETESFVRKMQKIYYEFFVNKKTPAQLHENPDYKDMVESELEYVKGSNNQWGRHWRFWQQIDSLNLADSWSRIDCPVLSIHGDADFIQCSAVESFLIAETVNKAHPGNAQNIHIADIDHLMSKSVDMKEAHKNFRDRDYMRNIQSHFNPKIAEVSLKWLNELRDKK
ncbi:MAG TPA: alpha/beta hydrolase, partial [Saprospiraceae bacterium]|nr:alpha/beta hydrolase [Saprospiraceae bacterium]